ncbi:MAG: hypothetical protein ISS65_01500 [Desulfobacterales bacterium]|uniref:Uncharacterized protein n=1 Tax=Candidatus Desulfatibia profunda TaxID=2841695 RepID=A0A8J6TP17_9BACT|nr:hypothetical protein [Candidatus Desulfatibia profunda]MBL7178870.1 hypothetical protein [Desulfobacterales bacterium]
MASNDNSAQHIKLDERNHVEKPRLNRITGTVRAPLLLTEPQEAGA